MKDIVLKLWDIFAEQHGCKPKQEDCSFSKCHKWSACSLLIEAISTHLEAEVTRAVEKYAKETVPRLNDKWRKRIDMEVLRARIDEANRYIKTFKYYGLNPCFFKERKATLTQKLKEKE